MKETRIKLVMPPEPTSEDPKAIMLWIKRLNVILPLYLDNLQRLVLEAQSMLYDVQVAVPEDENVVDAETQYANTDSAGLL
jgi:hypothetical protein